MKNRKFWLAGLVGSITYFAAGFLIYGLLMKDFMKTHSGLSAEIQAQFMKPETEVIWAPLIIAHFIWGYLVTLILSWSNISGFGRSFGAAFILGLLMCSGVDLTLYSISNMYTTVGMVADILASTLMTAISGGVIGIVLAMGKKTA